MPGTILNIEVDEDICAVLLKTCTVHGQKYVDIGTPHVHCALASLYSLPASNSTKVFH